MPAIAVPVRAESPVIDAGPPRHAVPQINGGATWCDVDALTGQVIHGTLPTCQRGRSDGTALIWHGAAAEMDGNLPVQAVCRGIFLGRSVTRAARREQPRPPPEAASHAAPGEATTGLDVPDGRR